MRCMLTSLSCPALHSSRWHCRPLSLCQATRDLCIRHGEDACRDLLLTAQHHLQAACRKPDSITVFLQAC